MLRTLILLMISALAACDGGEPAPARDAPAASAAPAAGALDTAREFTDVDLDACLAIARGTQDAAPRCPGFVPEAIADAAASCAEAGGTLVPYRNASLWALDIDGDAKDEYLFDVTENYRCDGAPGVLECGSLGCPVGLYGERDGTWRKLGDLSAAAAPAAEVLASADGGAYGRIRGGCAGARPCDQWDYYDWNGTGYAWTEIEDGGEWVRFAPRGGWRLEAETAVRAAPARDAPERARYPAGTEVIVIGEARDAGGYLYVSPCNACRSGFVEATALTK